MVELMIDKKRLFDYAQMSMRADGLYLMSANDRLGQACQYLSSDLDAPNDIGRLVHFCFSSSQM